MTIWLIETLVWTGLLIGLVLLLRRPVGIGVLVSRLRAVRSGVAHGLNENGSDDVMRTWSLVIYFTR